MSGEPSKGREGLKRPLVSFHGRHFILRLTGERGQPDF